MFGNSKSIIYLKRNALEVYQEKADSPQNKLDFPKDVAQNDEIFNQAKFEALLLDFLGKTIVKGQETIIVLSDEVLFQKIIPASKDESAQVQKFYEEVPLDPQKIVKKEIRQKDGLHLIVTNKSLFETIKNILAKLGHVTEMVIPATLLNLSQSQTLTGEDVGKILSGAEKAKDADFLTDDKAQTDNQTQDEQAPKESPENQNPFKNKMLMLLVVIFILLIGVLTAFYFVKKPHIPMKIPFITQKKTVVSINASSPLPSKNTVSQESEIDRSQIKVQVLNGTGKAGQALKVKEKLQNLNFSLIETANTPTQDFVKTEISFASSIPQSVRNEIQQELEKNFQEVQVLEDQTNQNYDIVITTGQELTY